MANVNVTLYDKQGNTLQPASVAAQITVNNAAGKASNVDAEITNLRSQISNIVSGEGLAFKGKLTAENGLPVADYKAGWQYVVGEAGTYAGQVCEVGDMLVCINSYVAPEPPAEGEEAPEPTVNNADWSVLQVNLVGAVTGPDKAVAQHVAAFADTSGKTILDTGFTIGVSVPADAKFTDTTYELATAQKDGLLAKGDFTKLQNAFVKGTDTADNLTDGKTKVVMTAAERQKLAGVAEGAEVNQNALAKVAVGDKTITADSKQDTLTFAAGAGITLSAEGKTVTVAETYVDSCIVTDLKNVPSNLRDGGLVILKA